MSVGVRLRLGEELVRGKRVLVIDDDPEMVELVRLIFERDGAEVCSAADGREGLYQYGACRPDLILLDVMMPSGMAGRPAGSCASSRTFRSSF